jgi:tetratricopeptide (TPR) repeat protein
LFPPQIKQPEKKMAKVSITKVEQHIGRARIAQKKYQELRCIVSLIEALKILIRHQYTSLELSKSQNLLASVVRDLAGMEKVKALSKKPLSYTKGKEKELAKALIPLGKILHEEERKENLDAARARKAKIDAGIHNGKSYLAAKKLDQARKAFREATEHYSDEDSLFNYIASILQKAGESKEALSYLQRAMEFEGEVDTALKTAHAAFAELKDPALAEKFYGKLAVKRPEDVRINLGLAEALAAGKRLEEAKEQARKAVGNAGTEKAARAILDRA